jgi:hypothetical protein
LKQENEGDEIDEESHLLQSIKVSHDEKRSQVDEIRDFLRQHRIDQYVLVPELSILPAMRGMDRLGEVLRILRPLVYVSGLLITHRRTHSRMPTMWIFWGLTLGMDLFAEWPQLKRLVWEAFSGKRFEPAAPAKASKSPIEREERQVRLLKLFLYLLREPLYSNVSRPYLNSVIETLSEWRVLRLLTGKLGPPRRTLANALSCCLIVSYS